MSGAADAARIDAIRLRVMREVSRIALTPDFLVRGRERLEVGPKTGFEEMGFDSLHRELLVMALDDEFGIEIPDTVVDAATCPDDLIAFLIASPSPLDVSQREGWMA
jgi:acyl carrier protein